MAEVAAFTGFKFQLYYLETVTLSQSPKPSKQISNLFHVNWGLKLY